MILLSLTDMILLTTDLTSQNDSFDSFVWLWLTFLIGKFIRWHLNFLNCATSFDPFEWLFCCVVVLWVTKLGLFVLCKIPFITTLIIKCFWSATQFYIKDNKKNIIKFIYNDNKIIKKNHHRWGCRPLCLAK